MGIKDNRTIDQKMEKIPMKWEVNNAGTTVMAVADGGEERKRKKNGGKGFYPGYLKHFL